MYGIYMNRSSENLMSMQRLSQNRVIHDLETGNLVRRNTVYDVHNPYDCSRLHYNLIQECCSLTCFIECIEDLWYKFGLSHHLIALHSNPPNSVEQLKVFIRKARAWRHLLTSNKVISVIPEATVEKYPSLTYRQLATSFQFISKLKLLDNIVTIQQSNPSKPFKEIFTEEHIKTFYILKTSLFSLSPKPNVTFSKSFYQL